jgi:hypothetical protein
MSNGINFFPPTQEELDATSAKGKETGLPGTVQREIVGEADITPVRNLPGFKEPLGRTYGQLARGFKKPFLDIGDFFLNAPIQAMKYAGVIPNDADENYLDRLFNSEDYQKQVEAIPYLLAYGQGKKGTAGDTAYDKIMRNIGEGGGFATGFLGLVGRSVKLAEQGAKDLIPPDTTFKAIKKSFTEYFEQNPEQAAKIELGLGGVSGLGAGVEEAVFDTRTGIGAMLPLYPLGISYLVTHGPLATAGRFLRDKTAGARQAISKKAGDIYDEAKLAAGDDATQGARADLERTKLGEQLKIITQDETVVDKLARTAEIEERLLSSPTNIEKQIFKDTDDVVPFSPAEATGEATLISTQKKIESTAEPEFVRANIERKYRVLASIENFKKDTLYSGNPDQIPDAPLYIVDTLNNRFTSTIGKIKAGQNEIADRINLISDMDSGLTPKLTSRRESGFNIREKLRETYTTLRNQTDEYAKELGIDKDETVGLVKNLQNTIKSKVMTAEGEEALSFKELHPIIRDFVKYDKDSISFQDWKRYRDQVGQALGKAVAMKRTTDIQDLKELKVGLDNLIDDFKGAGSNLKKFNEYYKNTLGPIEDSYVIKKAIAGKDRGEGDFIYQTADEAVANSFLTTTRSIEEYLDIARKSKDTESLIDDIRNAMLDKVNAKATSYVGAKAGLLDENKLNKFLNENKDILKLIPSKRSSVPGDQGERVGEMYDNLYDELLDGTNVLKSLNERNSLLKSRERKITTNRLYKKVAQAMNDENPEKIIDDALKNKGLMKELKSRLKLGVDKTDPGEVEAFNALVSARLFTKESPITNPIAFKNYVDNNQEILEEALGKEHYENLKIIADGYERILMTGGDDVKSGAGIIKPTETMEAIANATGTSVVSIQARLIAVAEGRISKFTAATYLASRLLSKNQSSRADAIFKEAMFNPKIAKQLASQGEVKPSGEVIFEKGYEPQKLRAYLFGIGLGGPYGEEGEKQEVIFSPIPKTEEQLSPSYFEEPEPEPQPSPRRGITTDVFQDSKITPPPTPNMTTSATDIGSLFPNDATAMAIAKRRAPQTGIGTLPT